MMPSTADDSVPLSILHHGDRIDNADVTVDEKPKYLTEDDLLDQTLYLPTRQVLLLTLTVALSYFLAIIEQTVTSTTLPTIASAFDGGKLVSWVVLAYLIGAAAIQMVFGRLCDIFGRRTLLLSSTVAFFITTVMCAFSQNLVMLMCCGSWPARSKWRWNNYRKLGLLADSIPMKRRGKYQAIFDTVTLIGQAVGPLVGAGTSTFSWRASFWVQLPLIALAFCLQLVYIPSKRTSGADWRVKLRSIDHGGCFLSLAFTLLLLVGLLRGGSEAPWGSAQVLGPLVASTAAFVLLLFWERRIAILPILPPRLFANRDFVGVLFFTGITFAANFIIVYYVPAFAQLARGLSLVESGLVALPYGAANSLCVFLSILASKRFGIKRVMITGTAIWTIGSGLLSLMNGSSSLGLIFGFNTVAGVGCGFCVVLSTLQLQACLPRADVAVAMSIRAYVRLLGAAIGTALASVAVLNGLPVKMDNLGLSNDIQQIIIDDPMSIRHELQTRLSSTTLDGIVQAYVDIYRIIFWMATGLLLCALIASAAILGQYSLDRPDDAELIAAGSQYADEKEREEGSRSAE